ncbi:hypothetical protein KLP40_19350 [Hymenobacter sp. NST-14]|uniref:hypothetical protein n=1 Tax=Hymenobacter piscis TaxID=2839984 RepID=UPI001C00CF55|nr:hypothetical protein [Hymenobacter piscis]MBT9395332.1 hypothetical protein [Hymenobacter piscis]
MRYRILEPLQADDTLAQLFNTYLRGLSTYEIVTVPRETMREYQQEMKQELAVEAVDTPSSLIDRSLRYYELVVLRNSLHGLHRSVVQALGTLNGFFTTYEGDLTRFAIENRIRSLQEYGDGEDDDWQWSGEGDKNDNTTWKPTYKDDPESIRPYSLHQELAGCFDGYDGREEYIGTSAPAHFEMFSQIVATQTELSFRRIMGSQLGEDIPVYRAEPGGEFAPLSLADQIEHELNEDLANARIVERFKGVLVLGADLLELYQTMDQTKVEPYYRLRALLEWMLEASYRKP